MPNCLKCKKPLRAIGRNRKNGKTLKVVLITIWIGKNGNTIKNAGKNIKMILCGNL